MTDPPDYDSSWDEVPTTPQAVSDEALGRHLVRRGSGSVPSGLATSVAARIARTKQEPGWRLTARSLRPIAALAACLIVVVVGSLIAMAPRPDGGGPGSTTFDPASRPLSVAELVRFMGTHPSVGTTVIVNDEIAGLMILCATGADCPIGGLNGALIATRLPTDQTGSSTDPDWYVYPANPAAPPALESVTSPLALRIRSGGGFTFLGNVAPASASRVAWSVADVASSLDPRDVAVVHGWLGASSLEPPCAPSLTSSSVVGIDGSPLDYGCGKVSFLTDTAVTAETTLAKGALRVQNGGYDAFGGYQTFGKPSASAPEQGTVPPREGTYLLRQALASPDCPADPAGATPCAGPLVQLGEEWELIARLDPLSIPPDMTAATPARTTTPTAAGPTWDPTQRPLTPPEFLRVLASHPAPGTVLIVDDQLVPASPFCPVMGACPNASLESGRVLVLPPQGGTLTFTTDSSTSTPFIGGPLAIQIGDPFPIFLGSVVSNGNRLAFSAYDLAARNAMGGLFVIPAWIVAGFPPACPAPNGSPSPASTSELGLAEPDYGCSPFTWLTDHEYQPDQVIDNGTSVQVTMTAPVDGFEIQPGAYQSYAPDPADDGHNGSLPRQGVFLVRDWAGHGEVLARLESTPIPPDVSAPTPVIDGTPTPDVTPVPSDQPGGSPPTSPVGTTVWPLAQLALRVLSGTIPSGAVVITILADSELTPVFKPGVVHSCPQLCPTWFVGPPDQQVAVLVSELSPQPNTHVGRVALIVVGKSLRLLGRAIAEPDGNPLDLASVPPGTGDVIAVHGWLRNGPAVACPTVPDSATILGLDQWQITYGCSGTWIQPAPSDPAVTGGDLLAPPGSVTVQDGADHASVTAREGTFLIRSISCFYPALGGCATILDHLDQFELLGEVESPGAGTGSDSAQVSVDPFLVPRMSSGQVRSVVLGLIHANEAAAGVVVAPPRILRMTATLSTHASLVEPAATAGTSGDVASIVWVVRAEGTFITQRGLSTDPVIAGSGYYVISDTDGSVIEMGFP